MAKRKSEDRRHAGVRAPAEVAEAVRILIHGIDAVQHVAVLTDRARRVDGVASQVIAAERELEVVVRGGLGLLGDEVDESRRRAGSVEDRCGPREDLDALDVEEVARHITRIGEAVPAEIT